MSALQTIKNIQLVAENIKSFSKEVYDLSEIVYEPDKATFADLLNDLERTINRIIILAKTRNQFEDISSFKERKSILDNLNKIHDKVKKSDNFLLELDSLKSDIRHFAYIDYTKTSTTVIKAEVEKLIRKQKELIAKKNQLVRTINTVSNNVDKTKENIEQSEKNRIYLDNLAKTLEKHNKQIQKQDEKYKQYDVKIETYTGEKKKALDQVDRITEKAREAMRLGVAAGISAAFQAQYDEIKGKPSKNKWYSWFINLFIGARIWVCAALLFASVAIGIGVWMGIEVDLKINTIVARLSLIFISLSVTGFCARQYVKRSDIATDYAYKSTLAKSIDAFSEKLKNKEDENDTSYKNYITKILDEIHQHPLANHKKQFDATLIEKIVGKVTEKRSK